MAGTDAAGAIVERYDYGDFGDPKILNLNYNPVPSNQSTIGNPYLFTGRRYAPETGLYWYRTRYYDPVAGRFTSRDRIGIWGDPSNLGNGLAYVGNSPWTWVDPFGRIKRDANGSIIQTPTGPPRHYNRRPGVSGVLQPVQIQADDGTKIDAYEQKGGHPGLKTDCHGVTFCDGTLWVDDSQVDKILDGDGYERVDPNAGDTPMPGDVEVYRDPKTGEVVHTTTVTKVDPKTGAIIEVEGLGGVESQTHKDPPGPGRGTAWRGNADRETYRKPRIPLRPTNGGKRLGPMGPPCPGP